MNQYTHSLCTGKGLPGVVPCTPEKSQAYKRKWQEEAQRKNLPLFHRQKSDSQIPFVQQARLPRQQKQPPTPLPQSGPGTELESILASIGLTPQGCKCKSRVRQMNEWGTEGCRENREIIINWLKEEERKRGWGEKIKAGLLTVTTGLFAKLSPTDPLGSLVDLALSRAEEIGKSQPNRV